MVGGVWGKSLPPNDPTDRESVDRFITTSTGTALAPSFPTHSSAARVCANVTIALRSDGTVKRLLGEERASPRKREGGIRYRQSYVDRWIDELALRSLAAAAAAYASIYLSPAQLQPVTRAQSEGAVPTCVMSVYVRRAYGRHACRANLVSTS